MHPYHHSLSSVKNFGGKLEDYMPIHHFFDESKAHFPDIRHRALFHHTNGIFLCEQVFGVTIVNSEDKHIPVRFIGEQHVKEDLGWIPTVGDWLKCLHVEPWMLRAAKER